MNKYNIFIDVKRIPSDIIVSTFLQNRYLLLLYD